MSAYCVLAPFVGWFHQCGESWGLVVASHWNSRRDAFTVSWHGDAHIYVDVVPLECEDEVFLTGPVLGDFVILPEGYEHMIGVCIPFVIDPKIVDDEGRNEVRRVVAPEGRCVWDRGISIPC